MRFLLHTMATPDLTPAEALDLAAELGLDGLDLICQAGYRCALRPDAPLEAARALRAEAEGRGLSIAALTPYEKRVNHPDPAEREAALLGLSHAIDLAAALGATSIRLFGGDAIAAPDWQAGAERMVPVLRRLAALAFPRGIALNIENHDGTQADSAARTAALHRMVGAANIGIVYDPANLIRDGQEGYPESLALQADAIELLHAKDYRFLGPGPHSAADEAGRRSVPVGDGDIPWRAIVAGLVDHGYDGDVTFEYEMRWVPDQLPPARMGVARSLAYLKGLFASARADLTSTDQEIP